MYLDYFDDEISQVGIIIDHHVKNNDSQLKDNDYIVRVYPLISETCSDMKEENDNKDDLKSFDVDIAVDMGKFSLFNEALEVLKKICESFLYKKREGKTLLKEEREVIRMIVEYLDKEEYDVSFLEVTKLGNILEYLKESIDEKEEVVCDIEKFIERIKRGVMEDN